MMDVQRTEAAGDERVIELARYVHHRAARLDQDLLPYGDPRGKTVLVFGYGLGPEVLWCARRSAHFIVGIDRAPVRAAPLDHLLRSEGLTPAYELRQEDVHDTALRGQQFDLIISNGVFEHVMDLKGVLSAFRPLLNRNGRIAIFADGLFYSSIGGHLGTDRWEHLWKSPAEIKADYPSRWDIWRERLNRMTAIDFFEAVRAVGLLVHQFRLGRDPHLLALPGHFERIRTAVQANPTDLSIVSIGCELSFIENL